MRCSSARLPGNDAAHDGPRRLATERPETAHSRLLAQGVEAEPICGAEFGAYVRTEYERYGRAIADANIKAE